MPRHKLSDPPIRIQAYIPSTLYVSVQLLLPTNPLLGRTQHGAMSQLMTELLSRWVDEQANSVQQTP